MTTNDIYKNSSRLRSGIPRKLFQGGLGMSKMFKDPKQEGEKEGWIRRREIANRNNLNCCLETFVKKIKFVFQAFISG